MNTIDDGNIQKSSLSLAELAFIFFRLGFTAFGGPAGHIALMEEEFVRRRNLLSREDFLDLLAITNLLPGPNSTEMAIHIGYRQAGFAGLFVAGICFIAPAFILVSIIAFLYLQYGKLSLMQSIFYGVKPVVIAVILQAVVNLAPLVANDATRRISAYYVGLFALLGFDEVVLLFSAGLAAVVVQYFRQGKTETRALYGLVSVCITLIVMSLVIPTKLVTNLPFSLPALFLYFLKLGSILYGSGYVLFAFLQNDLVSTFHWINSNQLLDAIAVGQMTPGPVFTTATFIGYLLGGMYGACLATLGIFLPAFCLVAISVNWAKKMRQSGLMSKFLEAVNGAALALIVVVGGKLAMSSIIDWLTGIIFVVSTILMLRLRINSVWLIFIAALLGCCLKHF